MKESKFVRTKIVAGYLLLIAVCILSVAYIYRVVFLYSAPDVNYSQLQGRRNVVNLTLYHLYQAESYGQFMLAGYQSYEARYRRELRTVRDCIDSLRSLSSGDDSLQTLRLDSITRLIADKERRTVSLRRTIRSGSTAGLLDQNIRDLIGPQASIVADTTPFRRIVYPDTVGGDTLGSDPWSARPLLRTLNRLVGSARKDSLQDGARRASRTLLPAHAVKDTITLVLRALQDSVTSKRLGIYDQAWQEGLRLRYNNDLVNAKIYQLILDFEAEDMTLFMERIRRNEALRRRASHVLGGVSAGSVVLMLLFVGILLRDVNRSNRYRRALERANRDKEALLEAREKLMLAITHDIKAPLGSVMGYIDLLGRLTTDRRQELYLDNMKASSEHLLALVNSLLDYYRLDVNKTEVSRVVFHPVQLFETIRAGFAAQAAAKGLELRLVAEPSAAGNVVGDAFHIRQIADNLISNALKFTDRGSVTIRVDRIGGSLVFAVRDTGRGISREEKKRIFGEFVRLRSAQGVDGFGLGLSIVDRLVKLLGGTISLESRPGEGSRFIVSVPVSEASARDLGASAAPDEARRPDLRSGVRVLLVDDDPLQLEMTTAMCRHAGMVPEACQYPEYVEKLVSEGRFDVVLTDIQMPAADGFTVLDTVRRAAPGVKVVAVSARGELGTADFEARGFDGCLRKPFSESELVAAIARACGAAAPVAASADGDAGGDVTDAPPASAAGAPDRAEASAPRSADGAPEDAPAAFTPDFSPLTAFAGSDPEAARSILCSFAEQTSANCAAFEAALAARDAAAVKSLAHKMLPIFTMLKADALARTLRQAETSEDPFAGGLRAALEECVATIRSLAEAARQTVAAEPGGGETPGAAPR